LAHKAASALTALGHLPLGRQARIVFGEALAVTGRRSRAVAVLTQGATGFAGDHGRLRLATVHLAGGDVTAAWQTTERLAENGLDCRDRLLLLSLSAIVAWRRGCSERATSFDGELAMRMQGAHPGVLLALERLQQRLKLREPLAAIVVDGNGRRCVTRREYERLRDEHYDLLYDGLRNTVRFADGDGSRRRHHLAYEGRYGTLLSTLMQRAGETFTRQELYETVWRNAYNPMYHDNNVYVAISNIRRALGEEGRGQSSFRWISRSDYRYGFDATRGRWALIIPVKRQVTS